mmetsp:Transcript_12688/g.27557  ORF Transcript_12688/g.27557 Transcript_12688/m.27557 type:complete len:533 (-) Transcript_12688:47-1645(-)
MNACLIVTEKIWVTTKEMTERLIHCGVDPSLETMDVANAIKKHNRGGRMNRNRYVHESYFRHGIFDQGMPKDQRIGQPLPMPTKNYFKKNPSAKGLLKIVNKDLKEVHKVREGVQMGEIKLMVESETQTDLKGGCAYEWENDKILVASPSASSGAEMGTQTDLKGVHAYDWEEEKLLVVRPVEQIEGEANARMLQPPQLAPDTEEGEQTPEQEEMATTNIDYSDGFGLFLINELTDFIQELAYHAAQCGGVYALDAIDFKDGAGITMKWKCSCSEVFIHKNCKWIRTDIVEVGRKWSRVQPELNIRLVKAAREVGLNLDKLVDFLAYLGVKASAYNNILHQENKVRVAVEDLSEERLKENLREHTKAARNKPNYRGDIVWTDESGKVHRTSQGPGSLDGAGLTRAYAHKMKGTRSVLIVYSALTNKPIMVIYNSIKCILCTRAYNRENESREQKLYLDDIRIMEHDGQCWRNNNTGPAGSEERQCGEAARRLLYDDAGEYRGDDEAVFLNEVCADNDTRGNCLSASLVHHLQ